MGQVGAPALLLVVVVMAVGVVGVMVVGVVAHGVQCLLFGATPGPGPPIWGGRIAALLPPLQPPVPTQNRVCGDACGLLQAAGPCCPAPGRGPPVLQPRCNHSRAHCVGGRMTSLIKCVCVWKVVWGWGSIRVLGSVARMACNHADHVPTLLSHDGKGSLTQSRCCDDAPFKLEIVQKVDHAKRQHPRCMRLIHQHPPKEHTSGGASLCKTQHAPVCACMRFAHGLQSSSGPVAAAAEVVGLTAAAHGIYVVWAWGQKAAFKRRQEYYSIGALGLSSLAFALQVGRGWGVWGWGRWQRGSRMLPGVTSGGTCLL